MLSRVQSTRVALNHREKMQKVCGCWSGWHLPLLRATGLIRNSATPVSSSMEKKAPAVRKLSVCKKNSTLEGEIDRERDRQTDRQTDRHRDRERQRERQTDRQKDTGIGRDRERERERESE